MGDVELRRRHLAVSGCRPPTSGRAADLALYSAIVADVRRVIGALPVGWTLVHGGAGGVDEVAGSSRGEEVPEEVHLPDYARYGLAAPCVRNAYVTTAERHIAWPAPWSRGTWDAICKRLRACGAAGFQLRMPGVQYAGVPHRVAVLMGKMGYRR